MAIALNPSTVWQSCVWDSHNPSCEYSTSHGTCTSVGGGLSEIVDADALITTRAVKVFVGMFREPKFHRLLLHSSLDIKKNKLEN